MPKPIYFPFADGRWHLKLGLKALNLHDWLEIDEEFESYLKRKADLLNTRYDDVVAGISGSEVAQQEVLELLLNYLPQRFPTHYERRGQAIANLSTGEIWHPADFTHTPLDLAGRLIQEDLCLLLPTEQGYVLGAASLCFPLYWRLREKLGDPLGHIHAPVPGYAEKLQRPMNGFFQHLQSEHPGYRFNWSLVDTPELFLGNHRTHSMSDAIDVGTVGDRLWLRVERQTLRRLPQTQAILFTVRTYIYPLSILQQYPEVAKGLSQALDHIPPAMQLYKSLAPVREVVQAYLGQIAISL